MGVWRSGLLALVATACISGVFAHQLFFRRVDVDNHPFLLLGVSFGLYLALATALQIQYTQYASAVASHGVAFLLMSSFVASIWASMLTYRAFFHPLNSFPGPFAARLSKFWAVRQAVKSGLKWYKVDAELHEKYGDYVRTGMLLSLTAGERMESNSRHYRPPGTFHPRSQSAEPHLGIHVKDAEGPFLRRHGRFCEHDPGQKAPQGKAQALGHIDEAM